MLECRGSWASLRLCSPHDLHCTTDCYFRTNPKSGTSSLTATRLVDIMGQATRHNQAHGTQARPAQVDASAASRSAGATKPTSTSRTLSIFLLMVFQAVCEIGLGCTRLSLTKEPWPRQSPAACNETANETRWATTCGTLCRPQGLCAGEASPERIGVKQILRRSVIGIRLYVVYSSSLCTTRTLASRTGRRDRLRSLPWLFFVTVSQIGHADILIWLILVTRTRCQHR